MTWKKEISRSWPTPARTWKIYSYHKTGCRPYHESQILLVKFLICYKKRLVLFKFIQFCIDQTKRQTHKIYKHTHTHIHYLKTSVGVAHCWILLSITHSAQGICGSLLTFIFDTICIGFTKTRDGAVRFCGKISQKNIAFAIQNFEENIAK